jgi:hypothetical protein
MLIVSGCSGSAGTGHGIVQFSDGEPVRSGSVEFRSLSDGSRYASRIAADGKFELADADGNAGCPPGNYEVVVVQIVLTEDLAAADHTHGRTVPRRYADYYTSALQAIKLQGDTSPLLITLEPRSD